MAQTITQRPDNRPYADPETAWDRILANLATREPGFTAEERNRLVISRISSAMASGAAPGTVT